MAWNPTRRAALLGGAGALTLAGTARTDPARLARRVTRDPQTPLVGLVPHGSEANLNAVIAGWTRDTGVPVSLRVVPVDDVQFSLTMGALSGVDQPDFALPPTFALPDLAKANLLQSHDRISGSLDAPREPAPLGIYRLGDVIDGDRVGMQTDGDIYLMFYRTDMRMRHAERFADAFGYPLAQPLTWPELDRQMGFFHSPARGRYGGALFRTSGYVVWEFWSRLHAKGALPFDRDLTPLLHGDEGIAALEQMVAATAHLHPATATAGLFENWDLFKSHDIYCNIGWGGSQKAFHASGSPLRGKLSYGRLPGEVRDHSSYFNWGWSYVVPVASQQPELAHLFASFATSPDHSTPAIRAVDGYFDPFLPDHYDDPVVRQIYSRTFLDTHRAALGDCIPDFYLPGHGAFAAALSMAIEDALACRARPKQALTAASEAWQVELLNHDRTEMVAKWGDLLDRYPAHFTEGI